MFWIRASLTHGSSYIFLISIILLSTILVLSVWFCPLLVHLQGSFFLFTFPSLTKKYLLPQVLNCLSKITLIFKMKQIKKGFSARFVGAHSLRTRLYWNKHVSTPFFKSRVATIPSTYSSLAVFFFLLKILLVLASSIKTLDK